MTTAATSLASLTQMDHYHHNELNLNYFDAVNDPRSDEPAGVQIKRFLVSQAIPMSLMGIPGIYLHSLLGSRNDYAGVRSTGRARSINREQIHFDRLLGELANPHSLRAQVFTALKQLLAIRARQSAFHPDAEQKIWTWVQPCLRWSGTTRHRPKPGGIAQRHGADSAASNKSSQSAAWQPR